MGARGYLPCRITLDPGHYYLRNSYNPGYHGGGDDANADIGDYRIHSLSTDRRLEIHRTNYSE